MADVGIVLAALVLIITFAALFGFLVYYLNAGFSIKS
jgi:hypothetical protein